MKYFLALCLIGVAGLCSNAQPIVYLRTGNIVNTAPEKNPSNDAAYFSDNVFDGKYFLWLQFKQIPTDEVKVNIEKTGVTFLEYLPDNTFIAAFPTSYDFNILNRYKDFYAVNKPRAAYKIDNSLFEPKNIPWAMDGNRIKVDVSFSSFISKSNFISLLKNKRIDHILISHPNQNIVSVFGDINAIKKIAELPITIYIEPIGAPAREEDIVAVTNHRSNFFNTSENWVSGRKINGSGITVGIGDGYMLGTHIDFQGRLLSNSSSMSGFNGTYHSDHVTGIVGGAGNLNPLVRGNAPGVMMNVYDNYEPYSLFPSIYNTDSVRIITHSLGQGCSSPNYNSNASTNDQILRLYPQLMYTHSSGNSGQDNTASCFTVMAGGYRTITGGFKAGKNVITCGNLSKTDVIALSSSRGPISDGRIKPDIAAVGTQVNSTQPNNTFDIFNGTSMATPGVCGSLALMYQAYKIKNNGSYPEGALMKAILLNTSDDLGEIGPDYVYGFGRINTRKAIKSIDDIKYITGNTITTGVTKTHTITIPANVVKARIMVYWPDWEGTSGAAKSLVNNIDAKIIAPDNVTVTLPWTMDISTGISTTTVTNPAIRYQDSLNNVEQIQLDNPVTGNYTLSIFGKAIPKGPQKYYIIYEYDILDEVVVTYPNGGESFITNETQTIRWDATDGTADFKVEYSLNNGTSWVTISNGLTPEARSVNWSIPTNATSNKALIKVTRNGVSDISDTNFVILRVPANLSIIATCSTGTTLTWTAVAGATGYDVFRLGGKYMELMGSTAFTTLLLNNQDNGVEYWYAVRAKMGVQGSNGRLSNAKNFTNNSVVPCVVPLKLISFTASLKGEAVLLKWITANESGMLNYTVERSTTPTFDNILEVGNIKPNNATTEQVYQLTDSKIIGNSKYYYRLKMTEQNKITYSSVQFVKTENAAGNSFVISPVPAKNILSVTNNDTGSKYFTVKIYNEIGVEVLSKISENINYGGIQNIDVSALSNGIYFVNIIDKSNGNLLHKQQISILK